MTGRWALLGCGGQAAAAWERQPARLLAVGACHGVRKPPHCRRCCTLVVFWQALLGDLDKRLAAGGAPSMDARERAVAIKKLLVATSTRGVDFAMVRCRWVV